MLLPMIEPIQIDTDFPGGNGLIERVEGARILLRPDLRDTEGEWFYWHVRVRGAEGRSLRFEFTRPHVLTCRGPAVSWDGGNTWEWGCAEKTDATGFACVVPEGANDVRLSVGIPYLAADLERWLAAHADHARLCRDALCRSEAGRQVDRLRVVTPGFRAPFGLLVTARHHACEAMAGYVLEGLLDAALGDDPLGRWFAETMELVAIPFMDVDGVERGDQGKNRRPHDHNRDYGPDTRYRSVAALKSWVPGWADGRPFVAIDLHCPWISNADNERIFQVGSASPQIAAEQRRLGRCVEAVRQGVLPYSVAHDWPYGRGWNIGDPTGPPRNFSGWVRGIPGCILATSWEIPYADASGVAMTRGRARAFGKDLAAGIREYWREGRLPA